MVKKVPQKDGGEAIELEAADLDTEGLIKVIKDGEEIHIHPDTLTSHLQAGWHLV